jgi:hypothetical protein
MNATYSIGFGNGLRAVTVTVIWILAKFDIEVMYFDIEAWTPIYVYPYIGLTKLRYRSTLF